MSIKHTIFVAIVAFSQAHGFVPDSAALQSTTPTKVDCSKLGNGYWYLDPLLGGRTLLSLKPGCILKRGQGEFLYVTAGPWLAAEARLFHFQPPHSLTHSLSVCLPHCPPQQLREDDVSMPRQSMRSPVLDLLRPHLPVSHGVVSERRVVSSGETGVQHRHDAHDAHDAVNR